MSDFIVQKNLEEFSTHNYRDLVSMETNRTPTVIESESDSNEQDDFDLARNNIKSIIEKGQDVLDDMIELARASDHPRSYEVTANLIKTLVETNKDLLEIHKKRKELKGKQETSATHHTQNVQNNTVFVGSGIDLLDMLNQK